MISKRLLEEYCSKYALATDIELLKQKLITLNTTVDAAVLEVAEVYDKCDHALKRLTTRQARETQATAPEVVEDDPITAKIMKRRGSRVVHAE